MDPPRGCMVHPQFAPSPGNGFGERKDQGKDQAKAGAAMAARSRGHAASHPRGGEAGICRAMGLPARASTASRPRPAPTSACCITTSATRKTFISRCSKAPMRRSAPRSAASISSISIRPRRSRRLIAFTWNYFLRNPEFLALLNTENLARAKHLKRSTKVKSMHSPFVEMIRTVVRRALASGDFQASRSIPVQLYISIAALSFFYLSNSATLERDLRPRPPEPGGEGRAARPHGGAGAGRADREIAAGVRAGAGAEPGGFRASFCLICHSGAREA